MKLVVKIGGEASEDRRQRRNLARQIATLRRSGHQVVLVHGGGKLLTQILTRLGVAVATEFHQGLRVTNAWTRDVALMVLAGMVNKQWVAEIEAQGQPALGICGGDANLVEARQISIAANGRRRSLGFVGRPHRVNTRILELAFRSGLVPVLASLALSARGEYLNVNADEFAAALAISLKADRLFYLTESGGVWGADRRLLPQIKLSEIRRLIRSGAVREGMIPKLQSCARTLRGDVGEVDIVSSSVPDVLVWSLQNPKRLGTRLVRDD